MTDIKNFFSKDKSIYNEPKEDFYMQSTLIHIAEAFSRITYKSIFLLDYYKQEFLYVSNNPLFLCGHTAKEVKKLGYSFFLEHVPEEEREMLIELNSNALKLWETFNDINKSQCYMSYHFHLKSGIKSNLVNQQITPILLTDDGKIRVVMCVVSLSSHKTIGHAEFHKKDFEHYWEYSFEKHDWEARKEIALNEQEVEVLKLSATGFTMTEIANKMCRSLHTIKFYKRNIFEKLGVTNISEAISRAISKKLF